MIISSASNTAIQHAGYALSDDTNHDQQSYRSNFARHIMSVSLYLQSEVMRQLTERLDHCNLRIGFEPYIAIAAQGGVRLSDMAELLGITRQAANQYVNQIENAGYLARIDDPSDGRAKILCLTKRGEKLVEDGSRQALQLQQQMEQIAGKQALQAAAISLYRLNKQLNLLTPIMAARQTAQPPLAGFLPRLSDHIANRLRQLTMQRGHPHLKLSFGQVLTSIGPGGGRIQSIADAYGVSKQAISAVVNDIERLGYLRCVTDPQDGRQLLLQFTTEGERLIADSLASVAQLQQEYIELMGERAFSQVSAVMKDLYQAMHLEAELLGNSTAVDIRVLAKQLSDQLGAAGAQALGKLLLSENG